MLRRRNMHLEAYSCVFWADSEDETVEHLFLHCPFAQQCWGSINLTVLLSWSPFTTFEHLRQQIAAPFFMEIIILLSWSIWTTRNNFIFNAIQPTVHNMKSTFIHEFAMVIHRAKQKYFPHIKIWLENLSQILVLFLFVPFCCNYYFVVFSIYNQQGSSPLVFHKKKEASRGFEVTKPRAHIFQLVIDLATTRSSDSARLLLLTCCLGGLHTAQL